ncbi:MAG: hypothetical protein ACRCWJ_15405 [Casimicrobium sp.]
MSGTATLIETRLSSSRRRGCAVLGSLVLAAFVALVTLISSVAPAHAGLVYVVVDGSDGLRVRGFTLDEVAGALTPIPGLTPLVIDETGYLESIGPRESLAVDRFNNRIYVLNRANRKVHGYAVNTATGALTELPFSPISLPTTLGIPSTVKINPTGSVLVVTENGSSSLAMVVLSYAITGSSATLAPGAPFTAFSPSASSTFSRSGDFFYAATRTGYRVNQTTGALTGLIDGVANTYTWGLDADASGRVYSVTTLLGEIRVSAADNTGTLTGNYTWPPGSVLSPLAGAYSGALSPDGRFYAVGRPGASEVGILRINESAGFSLSLVGVYSGPNSLFSDLLSYTSDSKILLVGENPASSGNKITTWFVDADTGALFAPRSTLSRQLGGGDSLRGLGNLAGGPANSPPCRANIDVDATIRATTDGLAIIRSMLNFPNSVAEPRALSYDVDGDGQVRAESDGLIFLRAMLGLKGSAVTNGINLSAANRNTWPLIRDYLNKRCGMNVPL